MSLIIKRHYKPLVLLVLVLGLLIWGLGDLRIIAYTAPGSISLVEASTDYANSVALFDESIVHTIQILISNEDYQQMITTYQETDEKDYFQADVIIDGVRMSNVGLRLKGNASLRAALGGTGGDGMAGRGQFNPEDMPGFGQAGDLPQFDPENMPGFGGDGAMPQFDPENMPDPGQRGAAPGGWARPEGVQPQAPAGGMFERGGGGMGDNTQIPLLIKFDEFISGQTYQGYARLAIRSSGISYDASMLQEPITNYVFRLAGLPATLTAYAGIQINEEAEQLFTISEVIDETFLESYFANPEGVLYKAELNATMSYQGEDPSAYANSFTQETRENEADMAPLIAFLRFLDESDDASFASQLPDYLDVESFATYLAVNNLLVNTDSMAGMGNNFYFYYDDISGRMTVLYWDGNESLSKLGGGATYDLYFQGNSSMGGRMSRGSNQLITRFLANPTFKALYEAELKQVYQQAFLSGAIEEFIAAHAALIQQANQKRALLDQESYNLAVAEVLDFITQRGAYLASTPLLGEQTSLPH
jgi:spore coat protein CotH